MKFLVVWISCLLFGVMQAQVPLPQVASRGDWRSTDLLPPPFPDVEISKDSQFSPQLEAFQAALIRLGVDPKLKSKSKGRLIVRKSDFENGDSYRIDSKDGSIVLSAPDSEGVAQGLGTLIQAIRIDEGRAYCEWLVVSDQPSQEFRCFMVDMGRNPHSPKTLRQVIDVMWLYKANYLQLHLTDDQLFSWPSKAFPKLYSERAGWTWEDFVELEKYSQARGVTIIPEVDMPGHSTLLRKHYPEVFGKTPTDLAKLPEAQKGVETLIAELLSVFKATPFYHMGGDEAYGVPVDLQRDFINRINTYVKSQGKQLIVWEGPHLGKGENKVATDVLHMIWRNTEVPAQTALDEGYQIVNASWDPLYIVDHYPRTMFTAVDVERCYNFDLKRWAHINHGFETFQNPHVTKSDEGILGFCMPWWEGREENILPLCLPRLAAVSAKAWNSDDETHFASFEERQRKVIPIVEKISGFKMPVLPLADPESQKDNLAYLGQVTSSAGASQPHFGPQRLTNGITDRFDHFLGFPTKPEPLEIVIELKVPANISRIVVTERAIGKSHEVYEVLVSEDGKAYSAVGSAKEGTRGGKDFVEHVFPTQKVSFIKIVTEGCEALTFPSFSRISEVQAFKK